MNKITEFVKGFSDEEIKNVTRIGDRYYQIRQDLLDYRDRIAENPFSAGVFLGEQKKDFKPSLALLEMLAKNSEKKIVVNEKTEWLFLCGRDVFESGILANGLIPRQPSGSLVLVQNKNDENLGLGRFETKDNKIMIKNLLDRGSFLRRERQK
jgi:ribosome biogenesis protein Nip4